MLTIQRACKLADSRFCSEQTSRARLPQGTNEPPHAGLVLCPMAQAFVHGLVEAHKIASQLGCIVWAGYENVKL